MRVVIVASGPSARGYVPPENVTVIAVNGAIEWLPRADYFFTLDLSPENMRRLNNPRDGVLYTYADSALSPRFGVSAKPYYFERISDLPFNNPVEYSPQWWANRWRCKLGLSNDFGKIHTGNSAWGALGLAKHIGATRVALVGVDASDEPRIDGGRSKNLSHMPLLFESAIGQIDFINRGKMKSRVPEMSIKKGMAWLCK